MGPGLIHLREGVTNCHMGCTPGKSGENGGSAGLVTSGCPPASKSHANIAQNTLRSHFPDSRHSRRSGQDALDDFRPLDAGEPGVEALELDAEGVVVDA